VKNAASAAPTTALGGIHILGAVAVGSISEEDCAACDPGFDPFDAIWV
jgi:hypothetical protein